MTTPWLALTFSMVWLIPSMLIPLEQSSTRAVRNPSSNPWNAVQAEKRERESLNFLRPRKDSSFIAIKKY